MKYHSKVFYCFYFYFFLEEREREEKQKITKEMKKCENKKKEVFVVPSEKVKKKKHISSKENTPEISSKTQIFSETPKVFVELLSQMPKPIGSQVDEKREKKNSSSNLPKTTPPHSQAENDNHSSATAILSVLSQSSQKEINTPVDKLSSSSSLSSPSSKHSPNSTLSTTLSLFESLRINKRGKKKRKIDVDDDTFTRMLGFFFI
jgi:hypothetical protein